MLKRGRPAYVTPEAFAIIEKVRERARDDRLKFIENFLWIKNKKRQMQRLTLNASQRLAWGVLEPMLNDPDHPTRVVFLKGRQVGITTLAAGLVFTEVYCNDNTDALVMAHLKDRTMKLFQMHHLFLKNLPSDLQLPLAKSSRMELGWEETNSGIALATAGTTSFGRGGTVPIVHASEAAYYGSLYETLGALEPSIPDEPGSIVILESTASGVGNEFHAFWEASVAGDTDFVPVFLPWFKEPLLTKKFDTEQAQHAWVEEFLDDELQARMDHYGLSIPQAYWYWWYRKNKLHGDDLLMQQEFPCDATECFISSGSPVFPLRLMATYRKNTRYGRLYDPFQDEGWTTLSDLREVDAYKGPVRRNVDPYLEIWNTPRSERQYVVSADTAEGIEGGDYSCAYVFDLATAKIVACLHGRIEPHDFARLIAKLGQQYNYAIIAPEVNGIGVATLAKLKDIYYNIYQWRMFDADGVVTTRRLGWWTDLTTRKILITHAKEQFKNQVETDGFVPCRELLDEISKFVYTGMDMKPAAGANAFDDRVMAWMIGLIVCAQEMDFAGNAGIVKGIGSDGPFLPTQNESIEEMISARINNPAYHINTTAETDWQLGDDDLEERII